MAKDAVLTVRVPLELKRRLERRAEREHRSASAQAVYELERALALESTASTGRRRQALGMVAAKKLPTEEDFAEVRARLWGRLGARDG